MKYNWQQNDWPGFNYDLSGIEDHLLLFAEKTGHISGMLKALPDATQTEAIIEMMVAEAVKTSEIEGEYLSRRDVMSSIKNKLGLNSESIPVSDKRAAGAGLLMIRVRETYHKALSKEQLFSWHKLLLSSSAVKVGQWRDHQEPMQVISGTIGKEKVHFEAPPSNMVPEEMDLFIAWFNETGPGGKREIKNAPVRSAVAHLYFESIHPFEDGNGRIGRAIAEKALSQTMGRPVLLSLSKAIESNKATYYEALKVAQQSNEITSWISYFCDVIFKAQINTEEQIDFVLRKSKFFDRYRDVLNERHIKVISRMLEEGPDGFKGGMNATKYESLTKVSKATATRDLQYLLEKRVFTLMETGRGRNTKYRVNI